MTFPKQVIINLSKQVTTWMVEQQLAASSNPSRQQTFKQLQQQMENLQVNLHSVLMCLDRWI